MSASYEDLYKHEFDHREGLRAAMGIPLGILVVIGGLLGAMVQLGWFDRGILCTLFWLAVTASSLFFARAVYFLVRSHHGHTYRLMPFAVERQEYLEELRDWHRIYGTGRQEGDREYAEWLERLYAEAADHNARVNLTKSEYLLVVGS